MLYLLLLFDLHLLARALAGAGIGPGTLAAQRQATTVTYTAIATQIHETLDVHCYFTAKIAFHREFTYTIAQLVDRIVVQVFDLGGGIYASLFAYETSTRASDTIDGGKRNLGMLVIRDVHPGNTGHE
jgi:hypothetical protein